MTLRRTRRLDIYIVIKELRKEHSEYSLCQLCMIGHVNRGAYYKWMNNPDSQNDALNKRIADKIMEIHGEHPDMGYRRIRDTLAHDHDINVSDKRVLRICRKKRVQSIIRHRYNCCTKPAADPVYIAENVLNREFHADHLNEKWVTDVSEFKYGAGNNDAKGKVYLSAILDLCDKRPVSYVCGDRNDNTLVFDTFDKALEANSGAKPLFHSDRGYQYTSKEFRQKIIDAGMTQSMSRVAHCIDNGPMEGFWGIMKREMYYGRKFRTREELVKAINEYMDYYTNIRVQRNLGVLTPKEFHEKMLLQAA
ncbi:IS3 family transposase [Porcincola sp. LCP21S3_C12]|uniref:IS3 family transposase n=1 Tax=Porcincola sp. LCP21S3_C12 TaxID=3438798 RepID=UPI003F94865F